MDQRIGDEPIGSCSRLESEAVDANSHRNRIESGGGLGEEGECEVVGTDACAKHMNEMGDCSIWILASGTSSDDGVPDEGGWGGDCVEELVSVVEVCGVGGGRKKH